MCWTRCCMCSWLHRSNTEVCRARKWNETRLAAAQRFGWLPSANEHVSQPLLPESVETVWSCMARALAPLVSAETLVRAETFMRKVSTRSTANDALDLLRSQAIQSGLNHAGKLQVSVLLQLAFVDTRQNLKLAQFQFATRQPLSAGFRGHRAKEYLRQHRCDCLRNATVRAGLCAVS